MKIDQVVVTTFPGYFFSTVLCLRSVQQYVPDVPISIIIDDFGLDAWPTYVQDCQDYISSQLPDQSIQYHLFSQIATVDRARAGGWFRQQLIKLHLDQILDTDHWLLIDADVVLKAPPDTDSVPSLPRLPGPIDIGNRLYVKHMLGTATPWLDCETESKFLCTSGIPIRYLSRDLLTQLRRRVEQVHNRNFLDLHQELISQQQLVAFDPDSNKMVMSEFQLIEYFRNRCHWQPLPIRSGAPEFDHTSIKDWNHPCCYFADMQIPDHYWKKLMTFGQTYI
jgi:hypothetical protein